MIVPGDVTPLFFSDCDAVVDPSAVWQAGTTPVGSPPTTTSFRNSAYSSLYGRAVAVGDTGTDRRFAYTDDGENWTRFNSPDDSVAWSCICWATDRHEFVALGNPGNAIAVSSTGLPGTWTLQTGVSGAWNAIIRSTRLGLYVAVNNSGSDPGVETSPDGVTWTGRNTGLTNVWYSVTDSSLGYLLAVGSKSADSKDTMTSVNATAWTSQGLITAGVPSQKWYDVNWNDTLNQFVACNHLVTDIATKAIAVSATGLSGSWTVYGIPSITFDIFNKIAYSPGFGYMTGGESGVICFSADGVSWAVSGSFGVGFQVFGLVWGSGWVDHGAFSAISANVTSTSAKIFKPYLPC